MIGLQQVGHRGAERLPWLTVLAVMMTAGLWLLFGPAPPDLVFDRAAIARGEGWRWFTGHLVHSDAGHALWDIAALAVIGLVLEPQGRLRMIMAVLTGMLAVDLGLVWLLPGLDRYCGLSGMLNTLFLVALAGLWQQRRHPLIPLVALGLAAKLGMENLAGQSLLVHTLWPSVPLAHLAGVLGGLAFLGVPAASLSLHYSGRKGRISTGRRPSSPSCSRRRPCNTC